MWATVEVVRCGVLVRPGLAALWALTLFVLVSLVVVLLPGSSVAASRAIPEGSSYRGWTVVFDGDLTSHSVKYRRGFIVAQPSTPAGPDRTHASLVTYRGQYDAVRFTSTVKTVRQLRDVPNPWETAWVVFDVKDAGTFNYVAVKTNGWEIGRVENHSEQMFFATGEQGTRVGQVRRVTVVSKPGRIRMVLHKANGRKVRATVSGTDVSWHGGRVGFYTEDARIRARLEKVVSL